MYVSTALYLSGCMNQLVFQNASFVLKQNEMFVAVCMQYIKGYFISFNLNVWPI